MEIILKEKDFARNIISNSDPTISIYQCINLLARYYVNHTDETDDKIFELISNYIITNYNVSIRPYEEHIEKTIKKSCCYPLININKIDVTRSEFIMIQQLQNIKLEQLMFTLLILAKYYDIRNYNNNHWVNYSPHGLLPYFKLANLTGNLLEKQSMIKDLIVSGLLKSNKTPDKLNYQVLFTDYDILSEVVYSVTKINNLGQQYLILINKGGYCKECNAFIKYGKTKRKEYCKCCAKQAKLASTNACKHKKRTSKTHIKTINM